MRVPANQSFEAIRLHQMSLASLSRRLGQSPPSLGFCVVPARSPRMKRGSISRSLPADSFAEPWMGFSLVSGSLSDTAPSWYSHENVFLYDQGGCQKEWRTGVKSRLAHSRHCLWFCYLRMELFLPNG